MELGLWLGCFDSMKNYTVSNGAFLMEIWNMGGVCLGLGKVGVECDWLLVWYRF